MATALKQEAPTSSTAGGPRVATAPAIDEPKGSKRKIVLPILGVLAIIGLVYFGKSYMYRRNHETTDNAQVDGHIVPVLAKVGGYVTAVNASENSPITSGATVVKIDDSEYRVRLAQADAELAAARAAVGGANGSGQAQAAIQVAASQRAASDAQIAAAKANYDKAAADLERVRDLADKQIVSRQQFDAARANAEALRATWVATQRQASAAGASVTNAEAGLRFASARLRAAQAARDNAALQLSYTGVVAPEAGTVSRKQVEVGQLVQPGQPLMSIVADTGVWVTANFKETQLSDIRVGQPVELEVDAYGGCAAEGVVESVSAATGAKFALLPPDNATGNFTKVVQRVPVRVKVTKGCGKDRPLRPGMSVVAHVRTSK